MDEEEEVQNEKNEQIKLEKEKQIAAGKDFFVIDNLRIFHNASGMGANIRVLVT